MTNHLAQTAYSQIKQKLQELEFIPGERLNINLLSEDLSMSSIPIREALTKLAAEDMIDYMPKLGYVCRSISKNSIEMDYEFLNMLILFSLTKFDVGSNIDHLYDAGDILSNELSFKECGFSASWHSINKILKVLAHESNNHLAELAMINVLDKTHYFRKHQIESGENAGDIVFHFSSLIKNIQNQKKSDSEKLCYKILNLQKRSINTTIDKINYLISKKITSNKSISITRL